MLGYRFNRMAAWLLAQPFAHGDLKPDNILVRKDGSLVLVDYDGMFVPAMEGEKARETGSPDYRHPLRTDSDFNEHIDDFSIAFIALSLRAIALNPSLKSAAVSGDTLLFCEKDFQQPADSTILRDIQNLTNDSELSMLLGIFYIAYAKKSLEALSFRLFMTAKPKQPVKSKDRDIKQVEKVDTSYSEKDIAEGVDDEYEVVYSPDGKRLLACTSELTEYVIRNGTQVICNGAFWGCSSLQSVTIPDSVTSIGDEAFYCCESLQSVTIPASVTSIGDKAFSECRSLQSVTIPDSVTTIGNHAFSWCKALQNVTIPDSVTSIGASAFSWCKSLQSVTIPDSVTSIGDSAFSWCKSLQSVTIPDSVTSIGENPFARCCNLHISVAPKSPYAVIANEFFIDKNGLLISYVGKSYTVVIPASVTSIGDDAFSCCESLQSVTIPASVTSIGNGAFSWCESLQSVTIPASVTSIGNEAFYCCESLQSVTIPASVTSIGNGAFSWCESLQSVTIPDSVTSIGDSAFSWCRSLQSVTIPDSVTSIGADAFPENCKVIRGKIR